MSNVIVSFWSLLAMMGVGYLLARFKITRPGADKALSRIIFSALIPALLFEAMIGSDPHAVFSEAALTNVIEAATLAALYALVAYFVFRQRGGAVTIGALCSSYTNAGNLGTAFLTVIVGDASQVAPILLFQLCVMVPISFAILDAQSGRKNMTWQRAILDVVTNPPVIAVFLGLLVALTNWHVPTAINEPISKMADAAIPVMMMSMGISWCGAQMPRLNRQSVPLFFAIFLRCIGGPLLAFAIGSAFRLSHHALLAVTVAGAFPTANNVFVYAHRYDTAVPFARDAVLISTVLSLGVTLIIAALFHI